MNKKLTILFCLILLLVSAGYLHQHHLIEKQNKQIHQLILRVESSESGQLMITETMTRNSFLLERLNVRVANLAEIRELLRTLDKIRIAMWTGEPVITNGS